MIARLRKIGNEVQVVVLILSARAIGRLPLPARIKQPLVRWLGIRAFLIVLGQRMNTLTIPKLRVVSEEEITARLARGPAQSR